MNMETLQTNVQLFKGKNFFQIFRTILLLNIWTWSEIYISQLTFCQKKKTSEGQNFQVSNVTESFPFFLFLRFCETMGSHTHTHTHKRERYFSLYIQRPSLCYIFWPAFWCYTFRKRIYICFFTRFCKILIQKLQKTRQKWAGVIVSTSLLEWAKKCLFLPNFLLWLHWNLSKTYKTHKKRRFLPAFGLWSTQTPVNIYNISRFLSLSLSLSFSR